MKHPEITPMETRAIAVRAQGLAENRAPFGSGKAGVLAAIEHLGYVQVDAVNVIQRAHHHVLWSRVPDYRAEMQHELQSPDVAVFEYWNHAASYLPTRDFRFSLPLMRDFRKRLHWSDDSPELQKSIRRLRKLIRDGGALKISDVESAGVTKGWSETSTGKIERRALHELWMRGDILLRSRSGMQKIFDLPSRVLPPETNLKMPTEKEAAEFQIRRALRALGVARAGELHYLQNAARKNSGRVVLNALVEAGEVIELRGSDEPKTPLFALKDALDLAAPVPREAVRFLSPFDNLTIQRKRLQWLFGFDYTVEIYVPAPKRKFGYFVLPILRGDRLIGRLDAKALRAERKLIVHYLAFEPWFKEWAAVKESFVAALDEFALFQGCDSWSITRAEPKSFRVPAASRRR